MKKFYNVLANTLIANVTTSFLWFALTFWVYLETRSVLATAIIGGSYMLMVAIFSLFFGTIVDHNKKKKVMLISSSITFVAYAIAGILYFLFPKGDLVDWSSLIFWFFGGIILIGGVVENMRNIALSTTVTLLVPKDDHAKANGLVGAVQGVAFLVTSVFSGLSIGFLGMGWTLVIAIVLTGVALIHLLFFVDTLKSVAAQSFLAAHSWVTLPYTSLELSILNTELTANSEFRIQNSYCRTSRHARFLTPALPHPILPS